MRRILVAITCLLMLSFQCEAQTIGHALRGLAKINVLVEDLGDEDIKCGLTEDLIRDAVLYPTSSAKIQVANELVSESLYVNTLSFFSEAAQFCVTTIVMEARSFEEEMLTSSRRKVRSEIVLWRDGRLASSNRSGHARLVAEGIEQLAKKFVTDWNLDNKIDENDAPAAAKRQVPDKGISFDDVPRAAKP
jgi:hypothetical protein